ncbi:hypothetical protein HETIRDRAFT_480192 [Heterobasidion irregulare TC 32-1]|uniref:RING-type domain-containing protein n=1 Tax=Heterobasidion irregulare (strain TC 32-1) TaxID=747525 RepID=W4JWP5_HETIT|nr:uncharacterized protein HETIRDRAFT_480192 [Heterobasidion irregulare TC 32-1]ETW77515.1 hypothetical protein HETIRDRAFT_480192 [Heterobasidion irregulare TC 32-1]
MTKHSKNNTASSIFSYAEYKKLDYGTKRQRLGNESMRRFDACALCLQRARDPVACNEGHLFCKECIYTDLRAPLPPLHALATSVLVSCAHADSAPPAPVTQKKDIKRQKARLAALRKDADAEKTAAQAAARARVLAEFEKGQLGLANPATITTSGDAKDGEPRGTKRKFTFDASAAEELAQAAEAAAARAIEREHAAALKDKLPDFWLPSLTPTYSSSASGGAPASLEDVRVQTSCRGGSVGHPIALKNLVPVSFSILPPSAIPTAAPTPTPTPTPTPAAAGDAAPDAVQGASRAPRAARAEDGTAMCPACKKELSNSLHIFLMKPCAHVVCRTCTDTLVRPAMQCVVCDRELKPADVLELKREGTGFAGGGMAETSKTGIAFQG